MYGKETYLIFFIIVLSCDAEDLMGLLNQEYYFSVSSYNCKESVYALCMCMTDAEIHNKRREHSWRILARV
jgi:hypothetical protein